MEGYRVGFAYLYPIEGIERQENVFDMTPENIANFIGSHLYDTQKIILTDMRDCLILNTKGGLLTVVPIRNCASKWLQHLLRFRWEIPWQKNFLS